MSTVTFMKNTHISVFSGLVLASILAAPAFAHSAPAILQLGGDKARASHGTGAACEEQRGVHLCGAVAKPTLAGTTPPQRIQPRIVTKVRVVAGLPNSQCRRSQEVFPGIGCRRTRRFTQGFYADRIARGF